MLPKTSTATLKDGTVYKIPTVVVSLDNSDAIAATSMWYFNDIEYDTDNDYNDNPIWFYNCKANPFANTSMINDASCAMKQ